MRSPLSRRGFLAAGSGLAAATAFPALAGCSSLASADSDPGTLVVHTQLGTTAPGSPTYRALVKEFHAEHPGLRIKNLVNGDDLPQVYETSRLARKDMIRVTKAAKEVFESSAKAMKEGRTPQWRFSNDRTDELQALIKAMEKM